VPVSDAPSTQNQVQNKCAKTAPYSTVVRLNYNKAYKKHPLRRVFFVLEIILLGSLKKGAVSIAD